MTTITKPKLRVADEVWIATALLHREHSGRSDFTVEEIVDRAAQETLTETRRPGVYVHVVQHCVANRAPNPGRYRMLFETTQGRRRLFRKGDPYHPMREGAKITPNVDDMPQGYEDLVTWYRDWSSKRPHESSKRDPLLALSGSGAHLWADEPADQYVRRLREGWE